MPHKLLKLRFTDPLHIGNVRLDYDHSADIIHSDTLYSAIFQAWNILGILDEEKDYTVEPLPFSVSSLFPFYQANKAEEEILFFPKPMGTLQATDYSHHKKLKKVRYIGLNAFKQLLSGIAFSDEEKEKWSNDAFFIDHQGFNPKFIYREVYPRARVPRYGEWNEETGRPQDTQIYYIERLFFEDHCGLFCILQTENEETEQKVLAAMALLQDEGLGTDRHVGHGRFELTVRDFDDLNEFWEKNSTYSISLSLYCPSSRKELENMLLNADGALDEHVKYETLKRGGWITSEPYLTIRKKSINMFKEGSVFRFNGREAGKIVDLNPTNGEDSGDRIPAKIPHPVYRVGKAMFLPYNLQN